MDTFTEYFGSGAEPIRLFFAPGRVNLIGEHTDYTGGYVFPAALSYGTWAAVRPRKGNMFRFASTSFPLQVECQADQLAYRKEDGWANYPKGIVQALSERGIELPGCDILFHGNIPHGAGLSSSASILLVTVKALASLAGADLPMIEMVKLAQRVENSYMGINCGIMDQFAIAMGKANHAILLRCHTLEHRYVPLRLGDYRLVIINSNKRRELAESKYNERRQECEDGFRQIKDMLPDAANLGSIGLEQWNINRCATYTKLPASSLIRW
jgi:galactokinase